MKPEVFLTTHELFTREELAGILQGRGRTQATVDAHLARWLQQGRIVRIKRGLFFRTGEPGAPGHLPDFIALASRMAADAAVAFHTALEYHGLAQSPFERLTFITWTKAKPTHFAGRSFVPVRPREPVLKADRGEPWIERGERGGTELRVTNLERTLADVLDRPNLAGGVEEVWRSLSSLAAFDPGVLEEYVLLLGSRSLAAKVGFFLESRRDDLAVPETLLKRLSGCIPRNPAFLDRRKKGRLVARWGLVVPWELLAE